MFKIGLCWNKIDGNAGASSRRSTRQGTGETHDIAVPGSRPSECRTLLSVSSFANLGYTAPFPPPTGQLGQPSQTGNIFTDTFSDQTSTSDTGVLNDHYWTGQNTITRSLPTWLQGTAGVQQLSIEFWLKVAVGKNTGYGTFLTLPGFNAVLNSNWGATPAGIIELSFTGDQGLEPLQNVVQDLGAVPDGQWHQYVATFDTKTACFYMDGQLVSQNWVTNDIGQIGPINLTSGSPATASTPTAITYTAINSFNSGNGISDVRISNTVLTPAQVERNFENYRSFSNVWYASPTGVLTNAGTQSSPFDLATALTHATTDNEIVLLPGTYNGASSTSPRAGSARSTTWSSPARITRRERPARRSSRPQELPKGP